MSIRYPIIFTELCFLCEQFVNHGVHKLHILRFRLRQKLSRFAAPPFPTANAVAGLRRGPLVWVKGRFYLYFWLSATASSSQRLLNSFSAWPLTQW